MTFEIETFKKHKFDLVPFTPEMKEAMDEELDGERLHFDTIKTPTAGGLAFEVPSDDPENPDVEKEIAGIVVHHQKVNAYWENDYDGANVQPTCSSRDGKTGLCPESGVVSNCATCPLNQFGSDKKGGTGKACKNMVHLYVMRSGSPLPVVLIVPPSSLKAWGEYLTRTIVMRGRKLNEVLTKVTLKKAQNANGIAYSQYVFSKLDDLTPDECATVVPMAKALKELCTANAASVVDLDAVGAAPKYVEVKDGDDLPF